MSSTQYLREKILAELKPEVQKLQEALHQARQKNHGLSSAVLREYAELSNSPAVRAVLMQYADECEDIKKSIDESWRALDKILRNLQEATELCEAWYQTSTYDVKASRIGSMLGFYHERAEMLMKVCETTSVVDLSKIDADLCMVAIRIFNKRIVKSSLCSIVMEYSQKLHKELKVLYAMILWIAAEYEDTHSGKFKEEPEETPKEEPKEETPKEETFEEEPKEEPEETFEEEDRIAAALLTCEEASIAMQEDQYDHKLHEKYAAARKELDSLIQ